jgi:DNA-binding NarL/FixJ family response regulator
MPKDDSRVDQAIRLPVRQTRRTRGGLRPGSKLVSELKAPPVPDGGARGSAAGPEASSGNLGTSPVVHEEAAASVARHGLVVGASGSGKSQLSVELLRQINPQLAEGWLIDTHTALANPLVRILIFVDDAHRRQRLQEALSNTDDIEVVGVATTAADALEGVKSVQPDVVLMDAESISSDWVDMASGISAIMHPQDESPRVGVLMVTADKDNATIAKALRAGASGWLPRSTPFDEIRTAVKAVAQSLSQYDLQSSLDFYADELRTPVDISVLNRREREILALIGRGMTLREIASELALSTSTVSVHIKNIGSKLFISRQADAGSEPLGIQPGEPPS